MFKNALYYQEEKESYKAKVLSCLPLEGKEKATWEKRVGKSFPALFLLRLSEEPFYPEGGGQAPDKGTIDGAELLFAENVEDEYIVHLLAKEIPEGTEVLCKVDYAYRRRQSENHSGEHIFAGLINRRFGYSNVGFHMELLGENPHVTVDFDGELSEEALSELETAVNAVIRQNLPVEEKYLEDDFGKENLKCLPDAEDGEKSEELETSVEQLSVEEPGEVLEQGKKTIEFRQKKALSGAIRVISIPEVDSCACCGTHVKRTGEIGLFKVLSFEKHRGGTRVFLLSGELAFLDTQKKEKLLLEASRKLSTDYQSLSERVDKLKEQTEEERGRRIALSLQAVELLGNSYKKELLIQQEKAVLTGKSLRGEGLEYYGNKNLAVFHFPDFEMILLNKACESLKAYVQTDFFCFSRRGEKEWQFAGTGCSGFLERFKKWKDTGHFSGGGREEMLQGRFLGTEEELKAWVDRAE
ncbi:alanyl-tRNA editing protein [Oribacterium asaccharolyticum]|uniref:alanyl-tRNA editing protein n=1 Tax=Oribacterium asaccharolyticum TaxID=1501332 RepID=UPI0028E7B164|nr:alanyl-tRNA editing protein [Oribacterium asaccharolyticum]